MAKVWVCKYGAAPTSGPMLADKPLAECVKLLRVVKTAFLGGVTAKKLFGQTDDAIADKGFEHVVVLVSEAEAGPSGWKAGFYLAPVTPKDAAVRLGVKPPPSAAPQPSAAPSSTKPTPPPPATPTPPPSAKPTTTAPPRPLPPTTKTTA